MATINGNMATSIDYEDKNIADRDEVKDFLLDMGSSIDQPTLIKTQVIVNELHTGGEVRSVCMDYEKGGDKGKFTSFAAFTSTESADTVFNTITGKQGLSLDYVDDVLGIWVGDSTEPNEFITLI